jgi:signal transduction histidine kinase
MKQNPENEIIEKLTWQYEQLKQFNYILAHNLKVPFSNIMALSEELADESYSRDEHKRFITDLSRSVKQIQNILQELNQIIRINENTEEQKQLINFDELVEAIKTSINFIIEKKNAVIVTDFSGAPELNSNKSYVYSIFYNLIVNSLTYQKPDVSPCIRITSAISNKKLQIIFEDNGMGIDMKRDGAKLFGMFRRLNNNIEGQGLGLFITRTQVEALGGTIEVESELEKGTKFIITIKTND